MWTDVSNKLQLLDDDYSSATETQTVEIDICLLSVEQTEAQRLMFEERLVLEDEQGQPLDEVTIAVEADKDMLLVYQYSQDESRLLRVQSRVHHSLDTDTELRRIRRADHTRTLSVTEAMDGYTVFVLSVTGRKGWRDKAEYDKSSNDLIILEGSNIVLLRKLAINRLFGRFRGQTINHEGELCECTYSVERGEDNDVIVRRVVTSSTGQETMTTRLSRGGYIRSHRWSSSDWRLVGGEVVTWTGSNVCSSEKEEQLAASELDAVDADIEAYFEKKEELMLLMKKYFLDLPDVQDMIADFVKNLLFEKPDDVVDFADKFFFEFVGFDWTSEGSDDSFSSLTYKSLSENKSNHTEQFDLAIHATLEKDGVQGLSLRNFIRAEILSAIMNDI